MAPHFTTSQLECAHALLIFFYSCFLHFRSDDVTWDARQEEGEEQDLFTCLENINIYRADNIKARFELKCLKEDQCPEREMEMYLMTISREPFIILLQNMELLGVAKSCSLLRELRKMMDLSGHDAELALSNILQYSGRALSARLNAMGVTKLPMGLLDRLRSTSNSTLPEAGHEDTQKQDPSPMGDIEYEAVRIISDSDSFGTLLTHIDLQGDSPTNPTTEQPYTPLEDQKQGIKDQSTSPTSYLTTIGSGGAYDEDARSAKRRRLDEGSVKASEPLANQLEDCLFFPLSKTSNQEDATKEPSVLHAYTDLSSQLYVSHRNRDLNPVTNDLFYTSCNS